MNELQPKIKEIQNKYKNDPQTQQAKMMEVYKENNYNPMSGCLVLLIQLPIILAFFCRVEGSCNLCIKSKAAYEAISKISLDSKFRTTRPPLGLANFGWNNYLFTNYAYDCQYAS